MLCRFIKRPNNRINLFLRFCTDNKKPPICDSDPDLKIPNEPDNCCMSGCSNCVWIEYAKELTKIYKDGGEQARILVMEKIKDPSLKVFLQLELKNLNKQDS